MVFGYRAFMESMQRGKAWEMCAFSIKARQLTVMIERQCWPFYHVMLQSDRLVVSGGHLSVGEYEGKALCIGMVVTHIISYSWGGCSYKVDTLQTQVPCDGHHSSFALD